ncbi:hypothetical protein Lsha_2311 [Legionella shakespearei DSM 23087]|uniref:Uncharacterized protein n=1 Tax=Legionella shakespearei DSM 23087 TaxID=1122169 RepID=A0A0W0YLL1_9GAMM|nr:hypothetical protein Lsha_2311 [Legionella shakespearei DSM 23087]
MGLCSPVCLQPGGVRTPTAIKLRSSAVPRLVHGIQESHSELRSLDTADKPRYGGVALNLMAVVRTPSRLQADRATAPGPFPDPRRHQLYVVLSASFGAKDLLKVAWCQYLEILRAKRRAQDDVVYQDKVSRLLPVT